MASTTQSAPGPSVPPLSYFSRKRGPAEPRGARGIEMSSQDEIEKAGADAYMEFERDTLTLVNSLNLLQSSARQMGASVGLLSATDQFRRRLKAVLLMARSNSAVLFPHFINKQPQYDPSSNMPTQPRSKPTPSLENFPDALKSLWRSMDQLMEFLKDFPEFDDEALDDALITCTGDLEYRIDCLEAYKGQFRTTAVRKYVHDICEDLRHHFGRLSSSLKEFVEFRVPTMASSRRNQGIINLTTFSIFFSGVTATTAGYSTSNVNPGFAAITSVLFLSALVLSVAAAINSLLGMTWHLASFRSPSHRVPFWITIWLRRSPLFFTVLSVLLFYAAIVTSVYSSDYHFLFWTVLSLTIFCSIGIASISLWFEAERWVYRAYNGDKWLLDVLTNFSSKLRQFTGVAWLQAAIGRIAALPFAVHNRLPQPREDLSRPTATTGLLRNAARRIAILAEGIPMTAVASMAFTQASDLVSNDMDDNILEPVTISSETPALQKLVVTHVVEHKALVKDLKFSPNGRYLASASWDNSAGIWNAPSEGVHPMVNKCKLATPGRVFQVAWSADSSLLLTRTIRTVNIWTVEGTKLETIGSRQNILHVLWLSDTKEFLLVEKGRIDHYKPIDPSTTEIRYQGTNVKPESYHVAGMDILDVSVMPDKKHAVVVGHAVTSHGDLQPMLTRTEKRVAIYEFSTRSIKRQAPLLQDVQHVIVSQDGKMALISYRHTAFPQCWKVEVRDQGQRSSLRVHRTYTCPGDVVFQGPARFGGAGADDFVIAPTEFKVLIWNRELGMLLYSLAVEKNSGIPVCLAWNFASTEFMMASGTHHGTVQLWNVFYSPTPMIPALDLTRDNTQGRPTPTATPGLLATSLYGA